ncbi:MAG: AraC family transcriptional regulator [Sphingobacteriaceae bacterium]
MITTYHLSDFSPFYEREQQFLITPFENLNRPSTFKWPHTHSFFEILWTKAGESKHIVDDHELDLSMDTIYFMSPGQVHHLEKHSAVKGDSIMFTEEFFILNFTSKEALEKLSFLRNSYKNPHLKLDQETKISLEPILQLMYAEFSRIPHSKLALSSLTFLLLNLLGRLYETHKTNNINGQFSLLDRFSSLLEQHYTAQKSIAFYAGHLCVTAHHLNSIIKKATGKAVSEMIRDRLMLETKRMLVHTDHPIGHIADELGYSDFSYFSRQFKKQTGISPDRFRTEIHQKYRMNEA